MTSLWTVQHITNSPNVRLVFGSTEHFLECKKVCAEELIEIAREHNKHVVPVNGVSLTHEDRRHLVTKSVEPEDEMF